MGDYTKVNLILKLKKSNETISFFNNDRFYWKDCSSSYYTHTSNTKLLDSKDNDYLVLYLDCDFKTYGAAADWSLDEFLDEVQDLLSDEYKQDDCDEFVGYIVYPGESFPNFVWVVDGKIFIDESYREYHLKTLEIYKNE